eukprot:g3513.t1
MRLVNIVIICLIFVSGVSCYGLTCKAGEHRPPTDIRTSGYASQCSGLSKITTEAECKLAAEYNSKNNIDENVGYQGVGSGADATCTPCPKDTPTTNLKTGQSKCISVPTIKCDPGQEFINDGITTKKECTQCKINTYSVGGDDIKCTPCSNDKPTTNGHTGQKSINSCKECEPGYGMVSSSKTQYYYCESCKYKIVHGKPTASPGGRSKCEICPSGSQPIDDHSRCEDPRIQNALDQFEKKLISQKEKQNDLSIKNSRLWQKEQIRMHHDELMKQRKDNDDRNEKNDCNNERNDGTIIFPAVDISNEIELNEDTTCIDTNRDELLKAFCSFRMDLDHLFQMQGSKKTTKQFWPNICCKERRDTTLKVCEDVTGTIQRENIIPFALSQGGDYSRHNLYAEVTDTIKRDGYLHKGMKQLVDSMDVNSNKKTETIDLINDFFNDISLCGPRIIDAPGGKDKGKLCQLFIPYKHSMTQFYDLINEIYIRKVPAQKANIASSFIEESVFDKTSNRNCACKGTMIDSEDDKKKEDDCGKHGFSYNWCYTVDNKC